MDQMKNPHAVAMGRLGGKAGTGKSKARKVTSAQARRAVMARWAKKRGNFPRYFRDTDSDIFVFRSERQGLCYFTDMKCWGFGEWEIGEVLTTAREIYAEEALKSLPSPEGIAAEFYAHYGKRHPAKRKEAK